jgi:two-component system NarL family sensor kinase
MEIYIVIAIGSILALVLIGFMFTVLYLYQRRRHKQAQELSRMKDQYEQEVLRSQLEIQEETFKMIGQELHDNIGQVLSVVKLSLAILPLDKEHEAYEQVLNARQILNKAALDLSDLTKSLHTDRIAQIGLAEAIRFEMENVRKSGIMKTEYELNGLEYDFDSQQSIFLFRMFQEMLNNVLKHSQAQTVSITLDYSDERQFVLILADNGVGFDIEAKRNTSSSSSGVGLKSIFNRAKLIGAELDMKSVPKQGTTATIQLSLSQDR